jgi:phosphate/sulfate permease
MYGRVVAGRSDYKATPRRMDRVFRAGQILSAAFSLNHGGNDAKKTMGIIMLLPATNQGFSAHVMTELVLADHVATGLVP